jgi:hypothetical protein
MKRKFLFVLTLVLAATFSMAVAVAGDNAKGRPFKGSMSGEATFDFASGACLDVTGAPWQTIGYMAGKLSHLGKSEWFVSHCSTLDGSQLVNGEGVLVAANGDEIWLTYTADLISPFTPPPVVLLYDQTNIVVGGTGRFEGASGEFKSLIAVTIESLTAPTTPAEAEFAGSITY